MNQNSEIFKKTRENSALTIQLNQKEKDYTELDRQLTIIKNKKAELDVKYNQLVKEYNNLQNINKRMNMANMINNGGSPNDNYPNVSGNFGSGKEYMSKTVRNGFMMGGASGAGSGSVPPQVRKSWKDTKLYKGTTLSHFKESRGEAYKKSEIQKILDDKDEVIKRQKMEIMMLKNKINERERELISKQSN